MNKIKQYIISLLFIALFSQILYAQSSFFESGGTSNKDIFMPLFNKATNKGEQTIYWDAANSGEGCNLTVNVKWYTTQGEYDNGTPTITLHFLYTPAQDVNRIFLHRKSYTKQDLEKVHALEDYHIKKYSWEGIYKNFKYSLVSNFSPAKGYTRSTPKFPKGHVLTMLPKGFMGSWEGLQSNNGTNIQPVFRINANWYETGATEAHIAYLNQQPTNKSKNATTEQRNSQYNSTGNEYQQATVAKVSVDANTNSVNAASSVDYTNKGNEYFSKDPDVAEMYYKKALEADPNNENAKTNLEKVQHNKRLIAQSKQLGIETSEMSHNMEQLSGHATDAITSGNSHAIGMTGVKTTELLAQSGASGTEAMLGGAGVAVGAAVLNSWMNPKVQYDVVKEYEDHTYKGATKNGNATNGIVIYKNGDVCKGDKFFTFENRVSILRGTCIFNNGTTIKGTFNSGPHYPKSGKVDYADGSTYKGMFSVNGFFTGSRKRIWSNGTYTSPDKQFIISGYFDENRKLSSGKYSYVYPNGNIISFSYPDYNTISIKYTNGDYFVIEKDKKSGWKMEGTYRKKAVGYGGKKAELNFLNIDEIIEKVNELGGKNNLAYLFSYISRNWNDELDNKEYYSKAMELAISDEQRQFIVDETNTKVSLVGLFNKWTRYSQSLRWNFYKLEECKKDVWFNYYSAIQCFDEDKEIEAEGFIDIAMANAPKDETKSNVFYKLGTYFYKKQNYIRAKDLLNHSLDKNPNNEFTNVVLGFVHYDLHDYEKSVRFLSKACELNPESPYGFRLALSNLCSGDYEEAKLQYKKYRKILDKEARAKAIEWLTSITNKGYDDDVINDIIENILQ